MARGFAFEIVRYRAAAVHAYAQLRNHFHLVCGPCRYNVRRFEARLKGAATKQLLAEGIHPLQKFADRAGNVPSPWSVKSWIVYQYTNEDMVRSIDYVRNNLVRARMAPQEYSFIVPYAGRARRANGTPGAAHRR